MEFSLFRTGSEISPIARRKRTGGAKDAVLRPEQFRALFPGHAEFLRVKRQLDPRGRFSSDMFRRLFPDAAS